MFTYARETLEKTGQLPPQQHEEIDGPDEDSMMTGGSSPGAASRSEEEKDSDDERKIATDELGLDKNYGLLNHDFSILSSVVLGKPMGVYLAYVITHHIVILRKSDNNCVRLSLCLC